MVELSQVIEKIRHPHLGFRTLNQRYYHQKSNVRYNIAGTDVTEEDWDNLLLLDACRYDIFGEANIIEGRSESRESRGADTVEFLRGNFQGRTLHDTVYVTASPMLYRHRDHIDVEFHDVINIWNDNGWDEEEKTVLPEPVTIAAREAADRYPTKRLLVHYLQPHYPFVGADTRPFHEEDAFMRPGEFGSWTRVAMGQIDTTRTEVWEAYYGCLEYVLKSIAPLVETLRGKTVVTSDHGNLLGERAFPVPIREWGHPRGLHVRNLVTVPWLVTEGDERREIVAEPPDTESQTEADDSTVEERLAQLGYVDAD